jgi:RNA polymerase primary sigma factor
MLKVLSQKSDLRLQNDHDIFPSISPEEQKKLFQEMERHPEHKQEIKNKIIEKNEGLIYLWMKRMKKLFSISGLEDKDLIQAGSLGLMRAVEKFKWRKGYRFSTYAIPWINQAMRRTIYNQSSIIFIPVYKREMITEYQRTKRELYQELKRSPSIQEIAEKMEIDTAGINHLKEIGKSPLSLEAPFSTEDRDNSLINIIVDKKTINPTERLEKEDLKKELAKSLSFLLPRERKILIMRFGLENMKKHTLQEIGKTICISRERVRQIQDKALKKLKWNNPQLRELIE